MNDLMNAPPHYRRYRDYDITVTKESHKLSLFIDENEIDTSFLNTKPVYTSVELFDYAIWVIEAMEATAACAPDFIHFDELQETKCTKCDGEKQVWNSSVKMMEDCTACLGKG